MRTPGSTAAAAGEAAGAAAAADNTVYIPLSELRELCTKSLSTLGYSNNEIAVLLEVRELPHGGGVDQEP